MYSYQPITASNATGWLRGKAAKGSPKNTTQFLQRQPAYSQENTCVAIFF